MSYDRSDLIPSATSLNASSLSPSSYGKGINLLVMHGTADTTIHPQNSMMLVRGVMQQQQQQYIPPGHAGTGGRRKNNSTKSRGRIAGVLPTQVGAIRISQLVMPDADLSNSRMAIGLENGSPIDYHHQLLHSIFGHVTQYLATECFTSVGDGNRGRGIRTRDRRLRKRRRRRWRTANRDQDKSDDQHQQQRGEEHQQRQQNQRSDNTNSGTSSENGSGAGAGGGDRSNGGRYRRYDIDSNQQISESSNKNNTVAERINVSDAYDDNKNISWHKRYVGNYTIPNNSKSKSKGRERDYDDDAEDVDEEYDEGEDSEDEYYDGEDKEEEERDEGDGESDKDE